MLLHLQATRNDIQTQSQWSMTAYYHKRPLATQVSVDPGYTGTTFQRSIKTPAREKVHTEDIKPYVTEKV